MQVIGVACGVSCYDGGVGAFYRRSMARFRG
jgi:hypothetical protein